MNRRIPKIVSYFWQGSFTFAKRDLKTRYAGSLLGSFWIILYPLAMAAITSAVFSIAFQKTTENVPFFLYSLAGFSSWIFFSQTVSASARSLIQNRDIIVNNKIDTELIIGGVIISRSVDLLITTLFLVVVSFFWGSLNILLGQLILGYLTIFLMTALLSLLVAAANVYFRDIQALTDIVLNFLFYATPVVYPISLIPLKYLWVFKLNPVTPIIMGIRGSILPVTSDFIALLITFLALLVLVSPVLLLYKNLEKGFAQYL